MPLSGPIVSQEYWRPSNPSAARIVQLVPPKTTCDKCGTEYVFGAQFCHVCGGERSRTLPPPAPQRSSLEDALDMETIRRRLGLSVPCLVFFLAGVACMVIAVGFGILYTPPTPSDWQATQLVTIEWLLGSAATLLAGILLKQESE